MAYSKDHTDQITDNWSAIINDVEMRYIVDLLIQKRVISSQDWEDMKRAHPLTKDQMHAFLNFLQKQPKSSFKKFIEALNESGKYDHIVDILQTKVSRNNPPRQSQSRFNAENFTLLWEEVHSNKKESDRKLKDMNKEIDNLKILLARKEKEIAILKEKNQKKDKKIEKLSNDFKAESQKRIDAESKLNTARGEYEMVLRENTTLLSLSRQATEEERQLREQTELQLRISEEELLRVRRENTHLLNSSRQDTETDSKKRPRKDPQATVRSLFLIETNKSSVRSRQREQKINPILPEVESSSNELALEQQRAHIIKNLRVRMQERDTLEREMKGSPICSIL